MAYIQDEKRRRKDRRQAIGVVLTVIAAFSTAIIMTRLWPRGVISSALFVMLIATLILTRDLEKDSGFL